MSNLSNTVNLIILRIDIGGSNHRSLIPIFEIDNDFTVNIEKFRPDTLELRFENEAERLSQEIWEKIYHREMMEDIQFVTQMVEEIFKVPNFIGTSSQYGSYTYKIVETDFEYIIAISYIN